MNVRGGNVLLRARDACRLRYTSRWGGCQTAQQQKVRDYPKCSKSHRGLELKHRERRGQAGGLGRQRKA